MMGALVALLLANCDRSARDSGHASSQSALDSLTLARADRLRARADSLDQAGDLAAAISTFAEEVDLRRAAAGDRDLSVATSLAAAAGLHLRAGNVEQARAMDQEALSIREEQLGARHPLVAQSLTALAWDHKDMTDRSAATRYFRRALAVQRSALGPNSEGELDILTGLANLYRVKHRADSALTLFEEVETARRARQTEDDRTLGVLLFDIAITLMPLERWSEALPRLEEAIERERRLGPRADLELARSLGAYGTVLRHLGRPEDALAPLSESARIFERLRAGSPPGPRRGGTYSLVSYTLLAAAELECGQDARAWGSLERPLARGMLEQMAERGGVDTTGWSSDPLVRVQAALARDQALIGWLTIRPGAAREEYPYWGYCIRDHGPVRWVRIDRPRDAGPSADDALDESRRELCRAAAWPLRVSDAREIRERNRAAYEARLAPLEPLLGGIRQLVVVAPDLAHGSPLSSWVDREGRWLAERFAISYAPSALLFAAARDADERSASSWRALLVEGDPRGGDALAPLAELPDEIDAVASELPLPAARVTARAAVPRLRALAASDSLAQFDLIHFAAHSAVDVAVHGESALLFAHSDSDRSGAPARAENPALRDPLELEELKSMHLGARLVTLSACESALGGFWMNDGYFGLPYACLVAGAKSVLASIWPVDDRATALLMRRFYHLLAAPDFHPGERLLEREAAALRDASLWLAAWRAEDGTTPFAHPVYWAGFVLMGGGPGVDGAQRTSAIGAVDTREPLAMRAK